MTGNAVLEVNADVVVFSWPFDQPQIAVLTLQNQGNTPITVKCKTTERYAIRFSWVYAVLEPGESKSLKVRCEATGRHPICHEGNHITFEYMMVNKPVSDLKKLWKFRNCSEKKCVAVYFDKHQNKKARLAELSSPGDERRLMDQPKNRWHNYGKRAQFAFPAHFAIPVSHDQTVQAENADAPSAPDFPQQVHPESFFNEKGNELGNFGPVIATSTPIAPNARIISDHVKPGDMPTSGELKLLGLKDSMNKQSNVGGAAMNEAIPGDPTHGTKMRNALRRAHEDLLSFPVTVKVPNSSHSHRSSNPTEPLSAAALDGYAEIVPPSVATAGLAEANYAGSAADNARMAEHNKARPPADGKPNEGPKPFGKAHFPDEHARI
uniref:Major sperm protein n=1 Tax=Trichuris muris TaxID=70415 RepID=A0A5S6QNV7_TRIMR